MALGTGLGFGFSCPTHIVKKMTAKSKTKNHIILVYAFESHTTWRCWVTQPWGINGAHAVGEGGKTLIVFVLPDNLVVNEEDSCRNGGEDIGIQTSLKHRHSNGVGIQTIKLYTYELSTFQNERLPAPSARGSIGTFLDGRTLRPYTTRPRENGVVGF